MKQITKDQVLSVYSGKDGMCCCGCAGKHYYPSNLLKEASKNRGYKVTPDEVNDKMISRVLKIINTHEHDFDNKTFVSSVIGKRVYIVYFRKNKA